MEADTTQVEDPTANAPADADEAVESMSSEAFLGGVDATEKGVESKEETTEVTPAEKTDQVEKADQNAEQEEVEDSGADKPMSESERNAYFAQRRIAAKQQNDAFIGDLKTETREYAEDVDETAFEDLSPEQAQILKDAQKMTREMQANEAVREVERVRESTAHSIIEAESRLDAFNPNHKDYIGEELHHEAIADWAAAYSVVRLDKQGNPQVVGVKEGAPSPYEYLEGKAAKYLKHSKELLARAQTNAARNAATTEVTPVQNSNKGGDSLQELEDRVGDISLV
jgi:hypothetical protein